MDKGLSDPVNRTKEPDTEEPANGEAARVATLEESRGGSNANVSLDFDIDVALDDALEQKQVLPTFSIRAVIAYVVKPSKCQ